MGKFAEISFLVGFFDLICFQETWLNLLNRISFKDYNIFRSDGMDLKMGGGSMIICKKSLNPVVHRIDTTGFPSCDMVMVSILDNRVCRDRVFFVSVYKPPSK